MTRDRDTGMGHVNLLTGCAGTALANGLQWLNEPPEWAVDEEGLRIVPRAPSDFFRPYGREPKDNACLLYRQTTGDFTAATCVDVVLADFGDAAAITVRASATQWAKLCLERSPIGEISVVSVVTDPWSDDSNGELVASPECHLRLTRKGNVFGMHYSTDGRTWRFVRTFGLEMPDEVKVGIHAQAPFTPGCRVRFRSLTISPEPVADLRSGE
jgi:regulation of enolase protein 1 (concanavalin A-like superfamily)